jgi:hypothetical protein
MILFQKPYVTLELDEKAKCLIQNWKGFATSEQFREAINQSVKFFEERKNLNKIISNTKDFAVVKKEDTDWVASTANPVLLKNGLKYMAFVLPTNVFTQVSVNNFKSKADDALQIKYFDDLDKAKQWISSL